MSDGADGILFSLLAHSSLAGDGDETCDSEYPIPQLGMEVPEPTNCKLYCTDHISDEYGEHYYPTTDEGKLCTKKVPGRRSWSDRVKDIKERPTWPDIPLPY